MSLAFQFESWVQMSSRSPSRPTQTTELRGDPSARSVREGALTPTGAPPLGTARLNGADPTVLNFPRSMPMFSVF